MSPDAYPTDDLLYRPIEHTLEFMTSQELTAVLGCGINFAREVLAGTRALTHDEEKTVWRWLASCPARGTVVVHHKAVTRQAVTALSWSEVCG